LKIRSRLLNKLATAIGVLLVRLLFWTCRIEVHADFPEANPYLSTGDERYLYCIWHDQIVMTIFSGRPNNLAGLVSQHQDGSYVADTMRWRGIQSVRGSTSRGGGRAMREMIKKTQDLHIAITPDGPRGPRREIKSGLVFLASHANRAIIPTAYACRRCWRISGSWTDMMIPKPFTKVVVRGGSPFVVSGQIRRAELDFFTAKLQAEMERLEVEAEALIRGEEIPRRETSKAA